jgi:hypothetical protein
LKYLLLALLAACSFQPRAAGTGGIDAPGVMIDAPGCHTFSSQTDTCALGSANDLTLSGSNSYDTDTGELNGSAVPHTTFIGQAGPIDVLVVHDFHMTLDATLRAVGGTPFGVIATGSILLDGMTLIDVSVGGAGARTSCPNAAVDGPDHGGGAGGGGGGGFGAPGGHGGSGDSDGTPTAGGAGGASVDPPQGPIGGCPGAQGGRGDHAGGPGGIAGGAVYLAAHTAITLAMTAAISAGGGGGGGGGAGGFMNNGDAGGGGGGTGGMIWLDAPQIRSMGTLAANGGGGGQASGDNVTGRVGSDALVSDMQAPGGNGGGSTGTDGGSGGAGTFAAHSVTNIDQGGGGGGGGAVGFIIVRSPDAQLNVVSPPKR